MGFLLKWKVLSFYWNLLVSDNFVLWHDVRKFGLAPGLKKKSWSPLIFVCMWWQIKQEDQEIGLKNDCACASLKLVANVMESCFHRKWLLFSGRNAEIVFKTFFDSVLTYRYKIFYKISWDFVHVCFLQISSFTTISIPVMKCVS